MTGQLPAPKSVSQLTREISDLVEANLGTEWVCGEVSNCRPARSGHFYFTLKDDTAQISSVIWRSTAERLNFDLVDGVQIIAAGRVEVYGARGVYQLMIQRAFPQGLGALEQALRRLRERLATEGLFDRERKRPLPPLPRRIALITSPHGAAIRDMLQIITRRWPAVDVVVIPVAVQGQGAAEEIALALRTVDLIPRVDVVITGRGGGSLEDLWAFNEEVVARAIADCPVPVISAVGHEIDVSISDLVADVRALTPSEAAELVVPDREDLRAELNSLQSRLVSALRQRAAQARLRLDALASRRVFTNPRQRIRQLSEYLDDLNDRVAQAARRRVDRSRQAISRLAGSLHALSPLSVLSRGYSMTFVSDPSPDGEVPARGRLIRNASDAGPGDHLLTYLHRGRLVSRVEQVQGDDSPEQSSSDRFDRKDGSPPDDSSGPPHGSTD